MGKGGLAKGEAVPASRSPWPSAGSLRCSSMRTRLGSGAFLHVAGHNPLGATDINGPRHTSHSESNRGLLGHWGWGCSQNRSWEHKRAQRAWSTLCPHRPPAQDPGPARAWWPSPGHRSAPDHGQPVTFWYLAGGPQKGAERLLLGRGRGGEAPEVPYQSLSSQKLFNL